MRYFFHFFADYCGYLGLIECNKHYLRLNIIDFWQSLLFPGPSSRFNSNDIEDKLVGRNCLFKLQLKNNLGFPVSYPYTVNFVFSCRQFLPYCFVGDLDYFMMLFLYMLSDLCSQVFVGWDCKLICWIKSYILLLN